MVGKVTSKALRERGVITTGLVRRHGAAAGVDQEWVLGTDDFAGVAEHWPSTLRCDIVVHLAARVHVLNDPAIDSLAAYRAVNVVGALRVARAACEAGARRFVFVSSVKAIGESSHGRPLREADVPALLDPYGISKLEAERALQEFGRASGLEIVIVRPPLVYGPGVRANFLKLMQAVASGLPLPLAAVDAKRSLVFVENLADALVHCAFDPRAAGQIFHVTDGRDLSVAELIRTLARSLHAPERLFPVPTSWLRFAGRLTGRTAQVERLIGELQVDSRHIREALGWTPPYAVEEGLQRTADWYRDTHH